MTKCNKCSSPLIWSCDYDSEDVGYEFEGIVAVYSCSYCDTMYEIVDNFDLDEQFIIEVHDMI